MKWSKWRTSEQLEEYRQQQVAIAEAAEANYQSLSPAEKERFRDHVPPLPKELPPIEGGFAVRHRAEVLLEHEDRGDLELSEEDREELLRIAADAPREGDENFLGGFDAFYEAFEP